MHLPSICSKLSYLYFLVFWCLGCMFHLNAQNFDQSYAQWKAQQQVHDQQLQQSKPDYYLARPTQQQFTKTASFSLDKSATIHLNQANIQQLQSLKGIGEKKAQAIVEYRQKHGSFKSIEELSNVKGIGAKFLEKNKDQLAL